MKNQYFGDVNDYCKYGLLRILTGRGMISSAICWMLTPDDGRTDGRFTRYLDEEQRWRAYDPRLFDMLRRSLRSRGLRDVRLIERSRLLPGARFHRTIVPDDGAGRGAYFRAFLSRARGAQLVFYDPDNGLEVRSKPYGRPGSAKYLYWSEILSTYTAGHAVLVYQHFPRRERGSFIADLARETLARTSAPLIQVWWTRRVAYLLLPQPAQRRFFETQGRALLQAWHPEVSASVFRRGVAGEVDRGLSARTDPVGGADRGLSARTGPRSLGLP